MNRQTFLRFRDLVYEKSGITLRDGKETLVAARIGKRMTALGLQDPMDYLNFVTRDQSGEEVVTLLDAISTNVTSFFREVDHFDFLKQAVSAGLTHNRKEFRFWSAACSSGEEPYTIAMIMDRMLRDHGGAASFKILATDISTVVLRKALEGSYEVEKAQQIPVEYQSCCQKIGDGSRFVIADRVKRAVSFARLNLSADSFPMKSPFDFIFCRNVMIYFDAEVRSKLVQRLSGILRPGGFLFVGHSETLTELPGGMKSVRPSIYRKEST